MRFLKLQNNNFFLLQNGKKLKLSTIPIQYLDKYNLMGTMYGSKYFSNPKSYTYKYVDQNTTYTNKY